MGQQQLLLLVMGIVIVAFSTIMGLNIFDQSESKARADAASAVMMEIYTKTLLYTAINQPHSVVAAPRTVPVHTWASH